VTIPARQVGRNDPCPCGSGKKYKRCCRPADEERAVAQAEDTEDDPLAQALVEPVEVAQSWYDIEDPDAVRALFARIQGARPDDRVGGDAWVLTGITDGLPDVPIAWARLGEDQLHVVSTYGGLLTSGRAFLESWDADDALYHVRSTIADPRITLEMLREESGEDAARELLTTTLRSYYERWIHCANPALDERAPLEVARSGKGPRLAMLHGVLTLLDELERGCPWIDGIAYDFGEVWRMLGIERERVLGPASDPARG
jgi:hypothetical protein